jgi:hypothetical protein
MEKRLKLDFEIDGHTLSGEVSSGDGRSASGSVRQPGKLK